MQYFGSRWESSSHAFRAAKSGWQQAHQHPGFCPFPAGNNLFRDGTTDGWKDARALGSGADALLGPVVVCSASWEADKHIMRPQPKCRRALRSIEFNLIQKITHCLTVSRYHVTTDCSQSEWFADSLWTVQVRRPRNEVWKAMRKRGRPQGLCWSQQGLYQVVFWSTLQPHSSVPSLLSSAWMSFCEPGEEAREGGTSVKSLWALQSLTGCPLSSCSSPGCPWSHVASTRPAASAWAQATLTVDGVFFTTRKYLLMFAIISALLLLQPSSLNSCNSTWQRCGMLSQSLGEPLSHTCTSRKVTGTYWRRLLN